MKDLQSAIVKIYSRIQHPIAPPLESTVLLSMCIVTVQDFNISNLIMQNSMITQIEKTKLYNTISNNCWHQYSNDK